MSFAVLEWIWGRMGAVYAVLFLRPNMVKNGCHGEPIWHDARREGIFRNQAAGSDEAVNLK